MKRIILNTKGLDCANCALELEKKLKQINGISNAKVVFVTGKIELEYDNERSLTVAKKYINQFENVKVIDNQTITIRTKGLDCPNCANKLENDLNAISGIVDAKVHFATGNIKLTYEGNQSLNQAKDFINHFEDVKIIETVESKHHNTKLIFIAIASILFIASFVGCLLLDGIWKGIIAYVGYGLTYLIVGYPILIKTVKSLKKGQIFDENFLMTIASIGAILVSIFSEENQMLEAAAVMLLYQIGEYLQAKAVGSSRKTIEKLVEMKSEGANLFVDGIIRTVDPSDLKIGDRILIKAGEKVPTDCEVTSGSSAVDMKSLTGEAKLVDVKRGDLLLSGSINVSGRIYATVKTEFKDSTVSKILDLVENSAATKAKPELFITKFAKYYTPIVCYISLALAIFAPVIEFLFTGSYPLSEWVIRALSVLVISCPCALIISVPLTYFGGIGACAKKGILVKGSTNLDELPKVKIALFDKTGTLTKGSFAVKRIIAKDVNFIKEIVSAVEKYSNHPISHALIKYPTNLIAEEVCEVSGLGMMAKINDKKVLIGNAKLLCKNKIQFKEIESLSTVIYVSYDEIYLGAIEIDDEEKADVKGFLKLLKKNGIEKVVMLTGDNTFRAHDFADKLDIDEVHASLLPQDKLIIAKKYQEDSKVLFVGDGINDSPVMIEADCSFSMGQLGSDAAVEASDFVLIKDDLSSVIDAIKISKKTRRIVIQNIIGSIAIKVIVMILGIFGLVPLWAAVLADVGVMLIAVLNALRIRW